MSREFCWIFLSPPLRRPLWRHFQATGNNGKWASSFPCRKVLIVHLKLLFAKQFNHDYKYIDTGTVKIILGAASILK